MVDVKDILYKAAEDVQSGMWCKGSWLQTSEGDIYDSFPWAINLATAPLNNLNRCAEGSIGVAVALIGGGRSEWEAATRAVSRNLPDCDCLPPGHTSIPHFNDDHLPDDPFEAGAQLAELFRSTADAL